MKVEQHMRSTWKVVDMNKGKSILTLTLIICFVLGNVAPLIHSAGEIMGRSPREFQKSQTSEYPPFEPPAANASRLDNGSVWVNGQEIFWRYFFPNTSTIQPLNFRFSFEIWWKTPDPGIVVVVELSENEGESNSTHSYGTLGTHEKILEMPDGDFIHYAIWGNTTYFFANETWASFGNEFIDEESLNLTVGIQHDIYFPIFEYTILRETSGPSIEIIHPNYDESENTLILDWDDTSFQVVITGLNYVDSLTFLVTYVNLTTFEPDEMIIWDIEDLQVDGSGAYLVPSLITEKLTDPEGGGLMDVDTENQITGSLIIVDGYGYETSKSMNIFLEYSNTTTTTTPTDGDWNLVWPIIGLTSIGGLAIVLLGIRRLRK